MIENKFEIIEQIYSSNHEGNKIKENPYDTPELIALADIDLDEQLEKLKANIPKIQLPKKKKLLINKRSIEDSAIEKTDFSKMSKRPPYPEKTIDRLKYNIGISDINPDNYIKSALHATQLNKNKFDNKAQDEFFPAEKPTKRVGKFNLSKL